MIGRSLMLATLILGFISTDAAFAAAQPIAEEAPGITQQGHSSGIYAFRVGDVRVTALSDGTVPQNLHELLHGIAHEKIDAQLAHAYQSSPVETSINAFLLEVSGRLAIVDTGAGEMFGPGYG